MSTNNSRPPAIYLDYERFYTGGSIPTSKYSTCSLSHPTGHSVPSVPLFHCQRPLLTPSLTLYSFLSLLVHARKKDWEEFQVQTALGIRQPWDQTAVEAGSLGSGQP